MARKVTIDAFTLSELKKSHPAAFERVQQRWVNAQSEVDWSDDTMDSLRAVIGACGGTLLDWSIGTDSWSSFLKVSVNNEDDEGSTKEDSWLYTEVLKPLGYQLNTKGAVEFPGHCPWTGYFADEEFIEAVYKSLHAGEPLDEALEGLASVASRLMEADEEQQNGEESMFANWDGLLFDSDGDEIKSKR